jgi:hypothetical protein
MLNRDALRAKLSAGPVAVIEEANRLGYCRGLFESGLEVIATPDGKDYIHPPSYTMRQAHAFIRAMSLLPAVDMGR